MNTMLCGIILGLVAMVILVWFSIPYVISQQVQEGEVVTITFIDQDITDVGMVIEDKETLPNGEESVSWKNVYILFGPTDTIPKRGNKISANTITIRDRLTGRCHTKIKNWELIRKEK